MFKKKSKQNKADIKSRIEILENDIKSWDKIIKKCDLDRMQAELNIAKASFELENLYEKIDSKQ